MTPLAISLVALRSVAILFSTLGDKRASDVLMQFADLISAGRATDAHMKWVADRLATGNALTSAEWDDWQQRINDDRAILHDDGPSPGSG